jgi:hypothetical protein
MNAKQMPTAPATGNDTGGNEPMVALVGRQIRRLNFAGRWRRKLPKTGAPGASSPPGIKLAGINFTGRRQHFL